MDQLGVTGSPDALGKLIKQDRKVFFESRSSELLLCVAFNGLLHPVQFGETHLQAGHATLDLRPRLIR